MNSLSINGCAAILSAGVLLRVPAEQIPGLRRRPGPPRGEPLPAGFLRHADEQTVVALAAVLLAADEQLPHAHFHDWGVLAAPRFLARDILAAALPRFQSEGAWDVSPHLIPHRSLHSISGTISQALAIHGPNFGVGGGPGGEGELLLSGMSLLHGLHLPGLWLVLSRIVPDLPPDGTGIPGAGTEVQALVLALRPGWGERCLHLRAADLSRSIDLDSLALLLGVSSLTLLDVQREPACV